MSTPDVVEMLRRGKPIPARWRERAAQEILRLRDQKSDLARQLETAEQLLLRTRIGKRDAADI